MKRTLTIVLGALAVSAGAFAQSPDVDKALKAAPANLREGATVIKWKSDFTYDTLKKGANKMVCYDLSGYPTHERTPFFVECTNLANLDRVAQNLKFEAIADKDARQKAFDDAEKDGTRVKPEFGSVWIHLMGADADHTRTHITVAVPGATAQSMGLPENGQQGGLWIMNKGTSTAHLMIPGN
jgi:hypothetical protein